MPLNANARGMQLKQNCGQMHAQLLSLFSLLDTVDLSTWQINRKTNTLFFGCERIYPWLFWSSGVVDRGKCKKGETGASSGFIPICLFPTCLPLTSLTFTLTSAFSHSTSLQHYCSLAHPPLSPLVIVICYQWPDSVWIFKLDSIAQRSSVYISRCHSTSTLFSSPLPLR